jgi:hypothetical protein
MNMHNINNEKILEKLRLIIVCNDDDFLSNAFNFLILEDCINIASSCNDLEALEILKKLINLYIKNLMKNDTNYGFRINKNDFSEYEKSINSLTDICVNQLNELDQELYQYKFKELIKNKDSYLLAFKELLK